MFYLCLFNAGFFVAAEEKPGKKNGDDNLANKSSARKLLEPLGQILTDYWDNNSEMDMNIDVFLLKFY